MSILGSNAQDIDFSEQDLCMVLGYLASSGRVGYIEAQIPEEKAFIFEREFPGAEYYPISQGVTSGGNLMKQGIQLRIYLLNINNCPDCLKKYLGVGTGRFPKRINKGRFVEKLVRKYGFSFGNNQLFPIIRERVMIYHSSYIDYFDYGASL